MEKNKVKKLKKLLEESGETDPARVKAEAKEFLKSVDANELIEAEQEMIDEGVTPEAMGHLCEAHLELMKDDLADIRLTLPQNHPIQTLMAEHEEILKFLDELDKLRQKIKKAEKFDDLSGEDYELLKHVTHHLVEAEKHHQREEEVLFPAAEAKGIYGPTQIMTQEHARLRPLKQNLDNLAKTVDKENFTAFKKDFILDAAQLIQELRDHIFKENYILYPATVEVISPDEWGKIRDDADKIGYCCFTPGYVKNSEQQGQKLDLRELPPFERHEKIFTILGSLNSGESLTIINDHDPKPLHYQLAAEQPDQFDWEYLQAGPKDWMVKISKK